eukprot:3603660-Rhodomonas_salina.1
MHEVDEMLGHLDAGAVTVRCALHTGPACLGVFGSQTRHKYGVVGSIVDSVDFLTRDEVLAMMHEVQSTIIIMKNAVVGA